MTFCLGFWRSRNSHSASRHAIFFAEPGVVIAAFHSARKVFGRNELCAICAELVLTNGLSWNNNATLYIVFVEIRVPAFASSEMYVSVFLTKTFCHNNRTYAPIYLGHPIRWIPRATHNILVKGGGRRRV